DHLYATLDLTVRDDLAVLDLQLRDDGHTGKPEQLGEHRAHLLLIVVDALHSEEHEVWRSSLQLRGECLRGREPVGRHIALEQHRAVRTHSERSAELLGGRSITDAHDHDLACALRLLQPQRRLDRKFVIRADHVLDARRIDRSAVYLDARFRVRYALDADVNVHVTAP